MGIKGIYTVKLVYIYILTIAILKFDSTVYVIVKFVKKMELIRFLKNKCTVFRTCSIFKRRLEQQRFKITGLLNRNISSLEYWITKQYTAVLYTTYGSLRYHSKDYRAQVESYINTKETT